MTAFFVTGSDTDVGKTFVTEALCHCLIACRKSVLGFKPISAGCESTLEGLRNEDALKLQAVSSFDVDYDLVNPIAFAQPIAPHIAAQRQNQKIDPNIIEHAFSELQQVGADTLLVEGAGGWRLPLGEGRFLSDFVVQHQLPVILVVGMKLGCLNHARLTAEIIKHDGLSIVGWVANVIDPDMDNLDDNIQALHELLDAPLLGKVPLVRSPQDACAYLDLTPLIG